MAVLIVERDGREQKKLTRIVKKNMRSGGWATWIKALVLGNGIELTDRAQRTCRDRRSRRESGEDLARQPLEGSADGTPRGAALAASAPCSRHGIQHARRHLVGLVSNVWRSVGRMTCDGSRRWNCFVLGLLFVAFSYAGIVICLAHWL